MSIGLLKLPPELRNQIYTHIWSDEDASSAFRLAPLLTCRQLRDEACLLAITRTIFHLYGTSALPEEFLCRIKSLSSYQIKAIRTLRLTAKISHLRALNETWQGLPFGHSLLYLDRLVITPMRPDVTTSCYAEVADLSQCHVLAYVLTEALKSMKNLRVLEVQNAGCFNEHIWKLLYRGLIYQLWRWGGSRCGMRFVQEHDYFRVMIGEDWQEGNEAGDELARLLTR